MKDADRCKGFMRKILERGGVALISLFLVGLLVQSVWATDVEMNGDIGVSGSVTATSFSGSGAGLISLDPTHITAGTAPIDISGSAASATQALIAIYAGNATTLENQSASDIINAASDEVRTPISSLPYTINSSGSYYLTDNLTSTDDGITVNADNVTIDFSGFTINGPGKSSATGYGVYMNARRNIEIKNGTIREFGLGGIEEVGQGTGLRIIHMRVEYNGASNFHLGIQGGGDVLIRDCYVNSNGGYGIMVNSTAGRSTIIGNTVSGNGDFGIYAYGSTIMHNTASDNGSSGIYAYGSTIMHNTASDNGSSGIEAGGSTIIGNTVYGNAASGIYTSNGSTITDNTANNNGKTGIDASYGYGSTITGNTAHNNGQHGIDAGKGSTVKNNTAFYNQWYGIHVGYYCLVDGNSAYLNNNAGGYGNINSCGTSCVFGANVGM